MRKDRPVIAHSFDVLVSALYILAPPLPAARSRTLVARTLRDDVRWRGRHPGSASQAARCAGAEAGDGGPGQGGIGGGGRLCRSGERGLALALWLSRSQFPRRRGAGGPGCHPDLCDRRQSAVLSCSECTRASVSPAGGAGPQGMSQPRLIRFGFLCFCFLPLGVRVVELSSVGTRARTRAL